MIVLTASSKQFRLDIVELCCSLQRSVRPMMQEACRERHRARVAECAISATHNSLKSQRARNLKSPISNDRAITSKLCIRSRPTAVKNHSASNSCASGQFPIAPAAPAVTTDRDFVPWRFSNAGRISAWRVTSFRRPRNLHTSKLMRCNKVGVVSTGQAFSSSSNAFASFRSSVSKPSVNQP